MKKFTILILAGLLLPAFCFGAVSYSRTPSGYTIENPVSFDISFDDFDDVVCDSVGGEEFWGIMTSGLVPTWYSDFFSSSTKSHLFSNNVLELGEYDEVGFICSIDGINLSGLGSQLEYNGGEFIFEVVEAEAPAGIFTIPNTTDITGYINDLFAGSGIYPLVALIIGLPLGFFVIRKVVDLKNEKEKKMKLGKLKEPATKKNDWL